VLGRFRRLFQDVWNLGLANAPAHAFLAGRPTGHLVHWLPPPPRGFFRADPFGLWHRGRLAVLYERYDLVARRGAIWSLELGAASDIYNEQPALALPGHASYPFLLEHGGEIFCVPETFLEREVALYRATGFPTRWVREAVLLRDIGAADTTVFFFAGRWWLACANHDRDPGAAVERLFLFHAPTLTGPYAPHALQPVTLNRGGARPAGTPFVHQGQLYRPGQDCSRTYGGAVVLHRVVELSPETYREEEVSRVEPVGVGVTGLHTFSAAGAVTLLDAKRPRLYPTLALRR
jgi:hypothetical protein